MDIPRLVWNRYTLELTLIVTGYLFYISVKRLLVEDLQTIAFDNAHKVINTELLLGFFWEADLQGWLLDNALWVVTFFNWSYSLGFFPVLIPSAIILFIFRYKTYVFFRNVFLISYAITWTLYLIFPAAPPRMMTGHGFIDTIAEMGPALYNTKEAIALYNQFSAMPSMHFGWTLLFGIIFFRSPHLPLRLFGVLYPALSLSAIVITANHYILDAIVGGAIILGSYGLYLLIRSSAVKLVVSNWISRLPPTKIAEHSARGTPLSNQSNKMSGGSRAIP